MGEQEVEADLHGGEEIEVHERPDTSPEVQGGQEGEDRHGVTQERCAGPPTLTMCPHPPVHAEHQAAEQEGEDDAIPGLDVLDDDLAVVEDEVVLHFPHGPPRRDDKSVTESVGHDDVGQQAVALLLPPVCQHAVGREHVAGAVLCRALYFFMESQNLILRLKFSSYLSDGEDFPLPREENIF